MKGLYKYLLVFCIMCNYFSNFVLRELGFGGNDATTLYKFVPDKYFNRAEVEMFVIFIAILVIVYIVKSPKLRYIKRNIHNYNYKGTAFYYLVISFYWLVIFFTLSDTNWGMDLSNRGVGQFELQNRQTLLQGISSNFLLPFLLYIYHVKFFGSNNARYVYLAILVYLFHSVASGGRSGVVSLGIMGFLYLYYIRRISRKYTLFFSFFILLVMSFSAAGRFEDNSIIMSTFVKIIQCNSTSEFLGVVKYSIDSGVGPYPLIFLMHFVSVLVPSYVLNSFGILSYSRTSLIYDELYNQNPDSGWGFMMLSDFYWCYEYWGYLMYLLVFWLVIRYFSKNIYSDNPVKMVMSIVVVFLFCNQRADFGTFVKPFVYTFVFLNILEHFRKKVIKR